MARSPLLRCVARLAVADDLPAPGAQALAGRIMVLLGGDAAERDTVAQAAHACGAETVDVASELDLDVAARLCGGADIVVDLNVTDTEDVYPGAWRAAWERTYRVLGALAADWGAERSATRCFYVAVTRLGGGLGTDGGAVGQPLSGLWAGLAKTLPRELPSCNIRVIDLADGEDVGRAVVTEIAKGRFTEVGWRGGRRHVLVPQPVPEPDGDRLADLDPSAVVVLSGGGRGIGYHLARHLRARWGCRVVITGRLDLSKVRPELLNLDEDNYRRASYDRLAACRGGPAIRHARLELERLGRARELWRNLEDARRAGQDFEYRCCDVTDKPQVDALITGIGAPIAMVIHNAGIDQPARIGHKSAASAADVVAVKVDGFLNLLDATTASSPGVLCAVGSLTGRYGGTAGQSDYAGANEALARLSEWAAARRSYPITCLSWPTWDSVGLITNLTAAVREMSAIPIEEGVVAWERELRRPGRGEVLFLGDIGMMSPRQVQGLPVPSDYGGRTALLGRRYQLGEMLHWAPPGFLETRHRFDAETVVAVNGFLVEGRPSLPIALAVELMVDAAAWLQPSFPGSPVIGLHDLSVQLGALRLPRSGRLILEREARGAWDGPWWRVDVRLRSVAGPGGPLEVARASVVCGEPLSDGMKTGVPLDETGSSGPAPRAQGQAVLAAPDRRGELAWSLSLGAMRATPGPRRRVWAEPRHASDLYASVHPCPPGLPVGIFEALLWASCPRDAGPTTELTIDRLDLGSGARLGCREGLVDLDRGEASARDEHGRFVLGWSGLQWSACGVAA